MAARVEDILVRLKLEGLEGLDRIRSSFRELGKVTQMSERDILTARTRLLEFATAAGNTEAVIAGLTPALKGLRAQVDICGDAYAELSRDIEQVSNVSRGYTDQAAAQRNALNAQTTAITNNVEALRRQRAALIDLQSTTRTGSQLYTQLGADIQRTTARLDEMDAVVRRTDAAAGRGLPSSAAKIRRDLADIRERIALERAAIDDLNLLTKKQREAFKQGDLAGPSGVVRAIAAHEASLSGQLVRQNMLSLSEGVRTQREAVRTANAMYNTPIAVTGKLSPEGLTRSFGELPNTVAGLNQQLSELRDRLNNTTLGTRTYVDAALLMAATQRQLREATLGVAAGLVEQLRAGNITPSMANLREVLASVRGEQSLLNTNTAEGARAFQLAEMRARALERQLAALQTTQASLSRTPASGFAAFSQSITAQEGNRAVEGSVRRNRERRAREQRRLEREAAQFFSEQPTLPLLLPAAGQTSAPGTGLQYSGQNVRLGRRPMAPDLGLVGQGTERFFGRGELGIAGIPGGLFTAPRFGPEATSEQSDRARNAYIAESDARRANAEAIEQQRVRMENLRGAVAKATSANTGSINSLGNLREALANLRNELPATNGEFKQLTNRLQDIDERSERLSTRAGRRLSGMQLAQGFGAALTGGIFGGPEGLIGGLGGLAVGGVGGAFAGAAFGAQAGMFRQQLAGLTDYSARIDKMQIALRGVVKDQASYNAVLDAQASITRDLNIPQENAIGGLTRLSAAVLGAGGSVTDSTFAYRAMTEAIKATGGSAEQVDGALLALTQVFSKGKVSAEELNQIAERLPGTFTLFAKAAGKTGPELQKALQQGQVGITDLTKFLQLLSKQYGAAALGVAASSQEAGARLAVTMQEMQRDVGRALQPVGAAFQTAFAAFITDVGPSLVATLKSIAPALQSMASLVPYIGELAKALLSLGAVVGLTAAFVKLGGAAVFLAGAIRSVGGIAAFATLQLQGLSGAITGATLINPWTAAAAGVAALTVAISKAALEQKALTDETARYVAAASKQRAPEVATSISKLEDQLRAARKAAQVYGPENRNVTTLTEPVVQGLIDLASGATTARNKVEELEIRLRKLQGVYRARIELDAVFRGQRGVPEGYKVINGRLAYRIPGGGYVDAETGQPIAAARTPQQQQQQQAGGGGRANQEAERAQREAQQAAEELAKQRIRLADLVHQHELDLINKRYELERDLINKQRDIWAQSQTGTARSTATTVNQFLREIEDLQARIRDAETAVTRASQQLGSAQAQQQVMTAPRGVGGPAPSSQTRALLLAAQQLGVSPLDLATIVGFETGGTYSPATRGGAGGNYIGLIQFGPTERRQYGAHPGQTFEEQILGPVVRYFKDRFTRQGMSTQGADLLTLYRTVLGGNPRASITGQDAFGTSPSSGVARMGPHRQEALNRFFGGSMANVGAVGTGSEQARGQGDVAAAQQELAQAKALRDQLTQQFAPQVRQAVQSATLQLTDELRSQNATLEDNVRLNELRNALQYAGVDQVIIDAELRKAEAAQKTSQQIELLNKLYDDQKIKLDALSKTLKAGDPALVAAQEVTNAYATQIADLNTELQRFVWLTDDATTAQLAFAQALSGRDRTGDRDVGAGIREGVDASLNSIGTLRSAVTDFTSTSLNGLGDALINLSTKGAADFRAFAISMLNDLSQLIFKQFVFNTLLNWIRNLGGGGGFGVPSLGGIPDFSSGFSGPASPFTLNAMGNAYAANGIVPFAYGGVVDQPMLFPFAKGGAMQTGVMGEAGPEAIIPLKRGRDGRLGVSGGGNTTNVTVNVDATNTSASSNTTQGQALGRVISQAVQGELVRQQRPGGLLDPNRTR